MEDDAENEIKSVFEIHEEIEKNFVRKDDESTPEFYRRVNEEAKKIFISQFPQHKDQLEKVQEALKKSEELEAQAMKFLNEAVAVLEETGVGRYFRISPLSQAYTSDVETLKQTFGVEDIEEIEEILEYLEIPIYSEYGDDIGGWEHSAVC